VSWLRIDDKMVRHPKICDLSDAAFRLHMAALGHCAEYETDGRIKESSAVTLTKHKNKTPLIRELVDAGLWEAMIGGWCIHDFLEWNPSHAELKAKRDSAKLRMKSARSHPVRANNIANEVENKERTNSEVREVVPARTGAPAGWASSGSGSALESGSGSDERARQIANAVRRHSIFDRLDADQIAQNHCEFMLARPQRMADVITAIGDCAAKCAGLGLTTQALQAKLVGFMRHARPPREDDPAEAARKAQEREQSDGRIVAIHDVPNPHADPAGFAAAMKRIGSGGAK